MRRFKGSRLSRKRWHEQRLKVWMRDGRRCTHCGAGLELSDADIDHIKPVAMGGGSGLKNLRTLCRKCHATRLDPTHYRMWQKCIKQKLITGKETLWE